MTTILSAYSEANGNMVELVIANNDDMGLGAITALETAGYNNGTGTTIPSSPWTVCRASWTPSMPARLPALWVQSASGLAEAVATLLQNYQETGDLMSNTEGMNVDADVAKIRVPYTTVG